jgi:hypothetical protein
MSAAAVLSLRRPDISSGTIFHARQPLFGATDAPVRHRVKCSDILAEAEKKCNIFFARPCAIFLSNKIPPARPLWNLLCEFTK